ncbi:MAG: bifunctional phosphoglucose/phosphomannose isomerase [Candidatus Diapherotrites archaeon]
MDKKKEEILEIVRSFPEQFWKAVEIGYSWKPPARLKGKKFRGVVICGMGGSGIGGLIAKGLLEEKSPVPIFISQDYSLPKFADKGWLAVIVSYSGNTEETLSAFREAKKRKMGIACISSGGILSEECENCISIPSGFAPRTQLGMTFVPVMAVLEKTGIACAGAEIEKTAVFLGSSIGWAEEDGRKIASFLKGKSPVVYSTRKFGSAALRFHAQLAENSKVFSHWNFLPELNHNEIVGFKPLEKNLAFVLFRERGETERERRRMEFTKKIICKKSRFIEVWAKGNTAMEKLFYFIMAGDFASYYLAFQNRSDPLKVENIERLKKELKK